MGRFGEGERRDLYSYGREKGKKKVMKKKSQSNFIFWEQEGSTGTHLSFASPLRSSQKKEKYIYNKGGGEVRPGTESEEELPSSR